MHTHSQEISPQTPHLGLVTLWGAGIYISAQLITGVEVGLFAAWLVLERGWSLPAALSWSVPMGMPLLLTHVMVLAGVARIFTTR